LTEAMLGRLRAHEGGLSDHPSDPGGLTKFGISQRSYPHLDVRNLTWDEAAAIYRRDYWDQPKLGDIPDAGLAEQVFDTAVNSGAGRAFRFLHQAVGTPEAPFWTAALRAALGKITDPAQWQVLRDTYLATRLRFFHRLALRRPANQAFLRGWLRRARAVAAAAPRLTPTPQQG
jgi:lysozyme family protein